MFWGGFKGLNPFSGGTKAPLGFIVLSLFLGRREPFLEPHHDSSPGLSCAAAPPLLGFYNGMKTSEVDTLAAETCAYMYARQGCFFFCDGGCFRFFFFFFAFWGFCLLR